MNKKQALRMATKRIEEQENRINELGNFVARQSADIKDYNACILDFIAGGSVCNWCEDKEECQRDCKGYIGCSEWWLRDNNGIAAVRDWARQDAENQGEKAGDSVAEDEGRAELLVQRMEEQG